MISDCLCPRCGIQLSIVCEYTCCKGAVHYISQNHCDPDFRHLLRIKSQADVQLMPHISLQERQSLPCLIIIIVVQAPIASHVPMFVPLKHTVAKRHPL